MKTSLECEIKRKSCADIMFSANTFDIIFAEFSECKLMNPDLIVLFSNSDPLMITSPSVA